MSMNERNDQIARSGQDLWSISGAKAGAIFGKGDVTHIMRTILNAPVASHQLKEALGRSLLPGQGGDDVHDLNGDLASLFGGDSTGELSYLGHTRPVSLEVVRKGRSDLDVTNFLASALQVD